MPGWQIDVVRENLRGLAARPFIPAGFFLASGIFCSHRFALSPHSLELNLLFIVPILIAMFFPWIRTPLSRLAFLALSAFLLGMWTESLHAASDLEPEDVSFQVGNRETVEVSGIVERAPEHGRRALQVLIRAEYCRPKGKPGRVCSGRVLVFVADGRVSCRAGDRVRAGLRLRDARNEGHPGCFDYAAYLKHRDIRVTAFLRKGSSIRLLERMAEDSLFSALERRRGRLAEWIESHARPESREVLKALSLGMRKAVPESVDRVFAASGTAHLLAISGLHLGVMALWVFWLSAGIARRLPFFLRRYAPGQVAALATLPAIWGYAFLAGLRLATLRAAVMVSVYLLGRLLWKRSDGMNSLFIAGFGILLFLPHSLFEPGFQLSFISVFGIIFGIPRIETLVSGFPRPRWARNRILRAAGTYLFFIMASSLVCFLVTAPVLAAHFHRISLSGLVMNVLVVPIFSLFLIPLLGLATALWFPAPELAHWPLHGADRLFSLTFQALQAATDRLDGVIYLPRSSLFLPLLTLSGLFLLASTFPRPHGRRGRPPGRIWPDGRRDRAARIAALYLILLSFGIFGFRLDAPALSNGMEIVVPHLPAGNAVMLRHPDGGTELFSVGRLLDGDRDPVKEILAPMVWNTGSTSVERVWLTGRSSSERDASERLKTFLDVHERLEADYSSSEWACRGPDDLRSCERKNDGSVVVLILRKQGRRGKDVLLFDVAFQTERLLILPSPHRIEARDWTRIRNVRGNPETHVIAFGPGRLKSFKEMIDRIGPASVTLSMNRHLRRYLSADDWRRMRTRFPEILRTDRDGAVRIRPGSPPEGLATTWRDVR